MLPVGTPLPALQASLHDQPDTTWNSRLYEGRWLVLNVWATWCPPCRAEMPSLQRLRDRLPADRWTVLTLSIDHDRLLVDEFRRRLGLDLPVYLDPQGTQARTLLGVRMFPETLILDPSGRLVERMIGERVWDSDDMLTHLLRLSGRQLDKADAGS